MRTAHHAPVVILASTLSMLSMLPSGQALATSARRVFLNAAVYTMNPRQPWAQAVVVEGNRFVYVGSARGARRQIDRNTQVHDLGGRLVLPGLVESHVHPTMGALLAGAQVLNHEASREQMLADIRKGIAARRGEKVLLLMGFKASLFGPQGPKAADLDAIEKDRPVMVLDYGGHSAWVNSRALQLAQITKATPDPIPGAHYYRRDAQGNPTGWCVEPLSFLPIFLKSGLVTPENLATAAARLFPAFSAFGYTTVYDAGALLEEEAFRLYARMEREGKLPFRVVASHMVNSPRSLPGALNELARLDRTYRSRLLRVNTLKIVYDGTLEALSCAMVQDFLVEKGNRGFELFPPETLARLVKQTDDAGYNIHIHAIGNRAISDVLSAFENLRRQKGLTPTRKTVCHVQFFMPDTVERFRALENVVAQTTPVWMSRDNVTEAAVGTEAYRRQVLFGSLARAGVRVTFGSDFPVSSGMEGLNPFNEIEVGHTRRSVKAGEADVLPPASEKLSLETLLRGYTIDGAYQLGMEDQVGSIEVGKLADLIVLEQNLFQQRPSRLHTNRVLMTVMDGTIVFDATRPRPPIRGAADAPHSR